MKAKFKDSHTLIVSEFNKTEDILANNMLECSSIANVSISKDADSHSILSLTSRPLNTLDIYPSIEKQQFNGLYNIVNVNPVTASIDKNIKPENIRKGVDILGISGTMLGRKPEETVTIDLDLSSGNQTVKPGDENSVLSEVTINKPDTLISSNIRKDINIAGIVGSLIDLDTSDATATANDMINPKTAYVNGQKVTGAMIPTYDSSVPSELGRNINLSGITIDDVNLDINLAIRASSGSSIEIYDIINDTISSETKTVINLTALTDTSVIKGTGRFNTTITMVNNKEYIRCYLMTKSSTTAYYVYSFLLNLQDKTIINEALVSIGEGASHAISLVVVPDKDIVISSTTGKNGGYLFTRVYFVCFNGISGTASKIIDDSQNGLAGSRSVANICVAPDKRTIGIFNHFNSMSFGTGTRAFTCVIRVSTDGTSYSTIQSNTVVSELCMLIDENTFIQNNSIKQIGTQALLGTSPFTINYGDRGILIGKYFYYLPSGSNNYSVYEWDSNEKTFTALSTLTTNGGAILHFAKEILYKNTDNALTGYVNDSTKGALMALYRNNTTFYNTQYANDISASNVLKNKKYFDINGLGIGTMPNNGELNYTPSDSEQTIPAGYTSGGTVNAIDYSNTLTPAEYTTALDTANEILSGKHIMTYVSDGLIAHYILSENTNNSIDGSMNLTNSGLTFVDNTCYNSTSNNIASTTALSNIDYNNFTISIYAKSTDTGLTSKEHAMLFGFFGTSTNTSCALKAYYGKLGIERYLNNNIVSTYKINQNEWHRYTAVVSNGTVTLYVDTEQVLQTSISKITPTSLGLMNYTNQIRMGWIGYASNALIYNRALTSEEIIQNYSVDKEVTE